MLTRPKRLPLVPFDKVMLLKITDYKVHVTDVSSASATGFFDPFTMQWAGWAMTLFHIQLSSLPTVVDTAGPDFTSTSPKIWGHAIPIVSCVSTYIYIYISINIRNNFSASNFIVWKTILPYGLWKNLPIIFKVLLHGFILYF